MEPIQKRVLLVEDTLFIHDLYARSLRKAGYDVLSAMDGEESLQLAKQKPDLILMDVMLPKMNGIEALRHLKSNPDTADIPVVLLTNLTEDSIIEQAFKIGAHGYILKVNLLPSQIKQAIQKFIEDPHFKEEFPPK